MAVAGLTSAPVRELAKVVSTHIGLPAGDGRILRVLAHGRNRRYATSWASKPKSSLLTGSSER